MFDAVAAQTDKGRGRGVAIDFRGLVDLRISVLLRFGLGKLDGRKACGEDVGRGCERRI